MSTTPHQESITAEGRAFVSSFFESLRTPYVFAEVLVVGESLELVVGVASGLP